MEVIGTPSKPGKKGYSSSLIFQFLKHGERGTNLKGFLRQGTFNLFSSDFRLLLWDWEEALEPNSSLPFYWLLLFPGVPFIPLHYQLISAIPLILKGIFLLNAQFILLWSLPKQGGVSRGKKRAYSLLNQSVGVNSSFKQPSALPAARSPRPLASCRLPTEKRCLSFPLFQKTLRAALSFSVFAARVFCSPRFSKPCVPHGYAPASCFGRSLR